MFCLSFSWLGLTSTNYIICVLCNPDWVLCHCFENTTLDPIMQWKYLSLGFIWLAQDVLFVSILTWPYQYQLHYMCSLQSADMGKRKSDLTGSSSLQWKCETCVQDAFLWGWAEGIFHYFPIHRWHFSPRSATTLDPMQIPKMALSRVNLTREWKFMRPFIKGDKNCFSFQFWIW